MKNKKYFAAGIVFSALFCLNAQEKNNGQEAIELPDVTTVVSGEAFTAGKDSVPDYRAILPENDGTEIQLPKLGSASNENDSQSQKLNFSPKEKDIYAEGELGAGFPFFFIGDFSVYRASGNSPFSLNFSHESTEGFARKKASEGYFERDTKVSGEKSYKSEKASHKVWGEYKTSNDGLQFKSDSFTDVVRHTVASGFTSFWNFSNGMFLDYGAEGSWYNRYGQLSEKTSGVDSFLKETAVLSLNPDFGFGWKNHMATVSFHANYLTQLNLEGNNALYKAPGSSSSESTHRFAFILSGKISKDNLSLSGEGSLITGNATGSKEIIPAFMLGLDYKTDLAEGRFLNISLKGGIESWQSQVSELENLYEYTVAACLPDESTDGFGTVDISVPVLETLKITGGFEFRKTIFGNGIWESDYKNPDNSLQGFYAAGNTSGLEITGTAEGIERTVLCTRAGVAFDWNKIKFSGEWKSFWKDVPALEENHVIAASALYQSQDGKWNCGAGVKSAFGKKADACPELSLSALYKFNPSLSVAFRLNDSLKLFTGNSRKYAHSQYIQKSGNAALLVKFQF